MGNTGTKEKSDHIDGGTLLPHGIYSGPQDYDFRIVQRLIQQRKLAPFYKGLEDWDDSEDAQEEKEKQLRTAASQSVATVAGVSTQNSSPSSHIHSSSSHNITRGNNTGNQGYTDHKNMTESERDMRRLYQGAIECPICFLYYPRNINRTRCCDKPMCTECFVQLKRLESAPTESPACPYCVEPHFGVIYSPTLLPAGLLSSPSPSTASTVVSGTSMSISSSSNSVERTSETQTPSSPPARRRSTSHKSPDVVTADELRPDWNRRILAAAQRQPGSRRASTSSSVSNATFALGRRLAVGRQGGSGSRRSNSSTAAADYNGYLTAMRNMGTDLEELMIMEAMRQSLQDEHDRQAREAAATSTASSNTDTNPNSGISPQQSQSSGSSAGREQGLSRSPLSSPVVPPSTSSSSSDMTHDHAQSSGPRSGRPDTSSLTSESEDGQDTDSEQDTPELLHNRAIRFATVSIPTPTPMETAMPKHRTQGPTSSPEAV
ncbi:SNF1-interacting protein [Mortierella sp. AD011]|nr:SNF1-interacting protein [Mortierella sp. AD010]KAF9402668.1 SNF1-interacting protein [Mortierella sp. AD011]